MSFHRCADAVARQLLHIGCRRQVFARRLTKRLCNRVIRVLLRRRRQRQQAVVLHSLGVYLGDRKAPLCQRARLIKNRNFQRRKRLQVVRALDEDPVFGRRAQSPEIGERDRNHQRAGTGHHQKDECRIDPTVPLARDKRGNQREKRGAPHHCGRVDAREFRDGVLGFGLHHLGIFDQFQNLGDRRFPERLLHRNAQQTADIDAAADDRVARPDLAKRRFARKRHRVQLGTAFQHTAVKRNLFPGAHHDDLADLYFVRRERDLRAVALDRCRVGTDVHQRGNRLAASSHRDVLEQFAHLVEQHDKDRLGIFADNKRANGGNHHQKMLVKQLPVPEIEDCRPHNIPSDQKIRNQEHRHSNIPCLLGQNARFGKEDGNKEQNARAENAEQAIGLLPRQTEQLHITVPSCSRGPRDGPAPQLPLRFHQIFRHPPPEPTSGQRN